MRNLQAPAGTIAEPVLLERGPQSVMEERLTPEAVARPQSTSYSPTKGWSHWRWQGRPFTVYLDPSRVGRQIQKGVSVLKMTLQ